MQAAGIKKRFEQGWTRFWEWVAIALSLIVAVGGLFVVLIQAARSAPTDESAHTSKAPK